MKKRIAYIGVLVLILMGQCVVAPASTYKIFEHWGGGVEDAEKSPGGECRCSPRHGHHP